MLFYESFLYDLVLIFIFYGSLSYFHNLLLFMEIDDKLSNTKQKISVLKILLTISVMGLRY